MFSFFSFWKEKKKKGDDGDAILMLKRGVCIMHKVNGRVHVAVCVLWGYNLGWVILHHAVALLVGEIVEIKRRVTKCVLCLFVCGV